MARQRFWRTAVLLLVAGGAPAVAAARAPPAPGVRGPAMSSQAIPGQTIPSQTWARQFDIVSRNTGRTYRIFVHQPEAPPPAAGYPVIMLTDANVSFPIATMAGMLAEVSKPGALIVGIGYPGDDIKKMTIQRNRDLTPSQPPGGIQQYPGYPVMTADDFGHSEDFHRFLVEELRPLLAAQWRTDPARQTLYGHSLGGMFVLTMLFRHPGSFQRYVAASPSIWWNDRAILGEEAAFLRRVEDGKVTARLLMTAGSLEDTVPDVLPPGMDRDKLVANFKLNGIIVNARGMADRLSQAKGAPGWHVDFHVFEGEDHNSVVPTAVSRAVNFAIAP